MSSEIQGFAHRFIPAAAPGAPTLLLLHGTGGNETDLLTLGRFLAPQAALLSPRGKVLEHGMARFFRRLAPGVFDEEDLTKRTDELAEFMDAAAMHYGFDRRHVIAVGFSNGANIAASLLLLRPDGLAGAILLAPMTPLEPNPLPDLAGISIFIGAGRHDPLVPTKNVERLSQVFTEAGAAVCMYWHAGGHELTSKTAEQAAHWLAALGRGDMP